MASQNEALTKRKGAIYKIKYNSDRGILKKGKAENLIKETVMYVRTGINRNNIQYVKDHPVNTDDNNKKEFWGEYINDRIVRHKTKGTLYLKCYLIKNKKLRGKTIYHLNGIEVDEQWLKDNDYISKSESSGENAVGDLFLPLDNIVFI